MKTTLLRLLPLLALFAFAAHAAEDKRIAAARAADDERVAATIAADRARLDAIFSNDLHYTHSNGKVDTKESLMKSLVSKASVYGGFDYKVREFTVAGPGVVLMHGRALVKAGANTLDLSFLGVWREENGKWRFLAWQSCRNPEPDAKK